MRATCLLVTLASGLLAGTAAAQDDRAAAVRLFRQGVEAYDAGRFEEAADLFEEANDLYPEPILVYNFARAQESLGNLQAARDAYQEYLQSEPDDAEAVRARVRVLDQRLQETEELRLRAEQAERERQAAREADEAAAAEPPSRAAPLTLTLSGAAATIAGATLVVLGQVWAARADEPERPLADAMETHERGRRFHRAGFVIGALGLAVVTAGVLWLLGRDGPEDDALTLRW